MASLCCHCPRIGPDWLVSPGLSDPRTREAQPEPETGEGQAVLPGGGEEKERRTTRETEGGFGLTGPSIAGDAPGEHERQNQARRRKRARGASAERGEVRPPSRSDRRPERERAHVLSADLLRVHALLQGM